MHFLSLYIIIVKLIGKNYLKKQSNCKIYKSGVQIDSDNTVLMLWLKCHVSKH